MSRQLRKVLTSCCERDSQQKQVNQQLSFQNKFKWLNHQLGI